MFCFVQVFVVVDVDDDDDELDRVSCSPGLPSHSRAMPSLKPEKGIEFKKKSQYPSSLLFVCYSDTCSDL